MAALLDSTIAPVWKLSVERYHAMIEHGILGPDDRLELLDGVLVEKMSKNPPHRIANFLVRRALEAMTPAGWYVDDQQPITLAQSEPEPDVAVIRGDTRDYLSRHPGAADVAIVIEISDASLERDRALKKRIYAAAEIPFYWLLNLVHYRLEICREPQEGEYRRIEFYLLGDVAPVVLDGREIGTIPVSDLLPPSEIQRPA